ncbi:hypothetical protein [Paenibacillus aceris]|uniref:DUF2642 domain-containing protein n=1 Tax=Paenibacillus aceris TaxID=869555 RepID=A0ABS4I9A5_9BACL|nr:hypothetical protein [Paenibacillus aceris]MBP1966951.1 hypothetical protein [Paenibacillus aceris]NHW39315.1 hypothetical protein [Paenibacillus aceris]
MGKSEHLRQEINLLRVTKPMSYLLKELMLQSVTVQTSAGLVSGELMIVGSDFILVKEVSGEGVMIPMTSIEVIY